MTIRNLNMDKAPSFKDQLKKQIGYLKRSCQLYDNGDHEEAIRMATSLRVLFHDTKNSTSLLKYLNATNIKINSTIGDLNLNENNLVFMVGGMYAIHQEPDPNYDKTRDPNYNNPDILTIVPPNMKVTYYPACITNPHCEYLAIPVDEWINQTVLKAPESITRRELYLGAANTDGGAHVDKKQKKQYSKIAYEGGAGFSTKTDTSGAYEMTPFGEMHLLLLRQMTHEVLTSSELLALLK